jgi:hypothetical protein
MKQAARLSTILFADLPTLIGVHEYLLSMQRCAGVLATVVEGESSGEISTVLGIKSCDNNHNRRINVHISSVAG